MKKISFALLIFATFSIASYAENVKTNNIKHNNIECITNLRCPVIIENKICDLPINADCDYYAMMVMDDCYLCDEFLSDVGFINLYRTIVEDCYRENGQ